MTQHALVVGGTSGLGLEIARLLLKEYDYTVSITGRRDTKEFEFINFDLTGGDIERQVRQLLHERLPIDLLVWSVGCYQHARGHIEQLEDCQIAAAVNASLVAPTMVLSRILRQQRLPGFIAITSISQWLPNEIEPIYCAAKAGLGMLANSVSLSGQVDKTLVVGPARMKPSDTGKYLSTKWVAEQTLEHFTGEFQYKSVQIMRDPIRVAVRESR